MVLSSRKVAKLLVRLQRCNHIKQILQTRFTSRKKILNLNLFILDKWIKDLSKVGYRDIRSIPDDEGTFTSEEKSPCIGRDALSGVYFHPATALGAQLSSTGSKWLKGQELYLQ